VGSILALLALTVDETDEAFANIYSTAVSLQNMFPRASQRRLIVGVATLATAISLGVNLTQYQQFLLLLGAFFVPLFGVLLADWLIAGRHYTRDDIFAGPAWRPGMIAAWLLGFALYEWIAQTQGLGFWSRWLSHLHPTTGGIGASLPSFAVSFVLATGITAVARARRPGHAPA
jgi:purine-cytosine permease-like protein